jgi:O-antigen/teichoic acid export membrane protein
MQPGGYVLADLTDERGPAGLAVMPDHRIVQSLGGAHAARSEMASGMAGDRSAGDAGGRGMALGLRRNAAWAFSGQVVAAACHWGGLIILGRLAGPDELGRYALALAVVTPILLFGGLQMREIQVADAKERYYFQDYLALRLAGIAGAGITIVAIALLGYSWQLAVPILLVGVAKGFESLSDVYYGLAQRHRRLDLVAQSTMLRGVSGLLALAICYYLTRNLELGLMCMAAAWGLVWCLFDRAKTRRWRQQPGSGPAWQLSFRRCLALGRTAVPLGVAMLLVALNPNVPRYFIEAMHGLGELGLFAAMAHFVVAGRMPITAVCQAAFPRLADLYAAGDRATFRHLLIRMMGFALLPGLVGLVVAIAFGHELLGLIYGPRFAEGADLFPWIMLVGVVLYVQTPFGYGMTAMHRFKVQPLIFGLVVLVNAIGCLVLVPRYGPLGATIPWLGSVVCQFVLSLIVHWVGLRRPIVARTATPAAPDLS